MLPAVAAGEVQTPQDPSGVEQLAAEGIALAPDEQDADLVVVGGQPGERDTVVITPDGCASAACEQVVRSDFAPASPGAPPPGPGALTASAAGYRAAGRARVITLGNVRAKISIRKRASAKHSKSTSKSSSGLLTRAAAVPSINGWSIADQTCSNLGCWAWHINMTSISYYDSSYAWGTRSRYGYVGRINCAAGANGYSTAREDCQFYGDPSAYDLYAAAQYNISAPWPVPINQEHYLHRHVDKNGRYWLVAN
jgi:hypothetical protein